jgi:hypothetical protein
MWGISSTAKELEISKCGLFSMELVTMALFAERFNKTRLLNPAVSGFVVNHVKTD